MHNFVNRRRKGQGMTEYIIIVAVIAVLSIAIVTQFGDTIRMWFSASSDRMVGDKTTTIQRQTSGGDFRKKMDSGF